MRLSNLNKLLVFFLIIFLTHIVNAEDSVDIWKKKNTDKDKIKSDNNSNEQSDSKIVITSDDKKSETNIKILDNLSPSTTDTKLYGLYDPDQNNFDLNMWASSDGKNIKNIIKRINNLELSSTAEKIFLDTMLSYSYLPKNISESEFLDVKINWLIKNKKDRILENFLEKNTEFNNKKKVIQYLVDRNIANANLKLGCEKVIFIGKDIKDSYLEKFKIYCLILNKKNNQAQLLYDILKEQNQSDKYFDDKINFLLGLTEKVSSKIKDDNLLNFYLASVTVKDFKYEPTNKTKKSIWEYLDTANLINIDDLENKDKIRDLEIAAKNNQIQKAKIFKIYTKIQFDLDTLINAENNFRVLDSIDSRALIYQKFLLSDNVENKLKFLFILKDLFKKDNLSGVYTKFLSDNLKLFKSDEIPESYQGIVKRHIISDKDIKFGKIKYDDKILHKSKVLRHFTFEKKSIKKTQKDFDSIYKKIKRNKNYFFSAKDLALVEALDYDGIIIPKELNFKKISTKYNIPESLLKLAENNEKGFLALKIVEIIGEDEVTNLDPETIYFITHLLNKSQLIEFRNEILSSALPLRT